MPFARAFSLGGQLQTTVALVAHWLWAAVFYLSAAAL